MRDREKKTCQVSAANMPGEKGFVLVMANHTTAFDN